MIYLVGYPRSGTTLVLNQLVELKAIQSGPETHFYRYFNGNINLRGLTIDEAITKISSNKRMLDFGLSKNDLEFILKNKQYDRNFLKSFIDQYLIKKGLDPKHVVFIEKTPAHILFFSEILKIDEEAKFIFIVRDPRDVVFSNLKVNWTHNNYFKHAVEWNIYFDQYLKLKSFNSRKVIFVKYENFLSDTENEIHKICNFLNIDNIKKVDLSQSLDTIPDWELNWKQNSSEEIDKLHADQWIKGDKNIYQIVEHICSRRMKILGYKMSKKNNLTFVNRIKILFFNSIISRKLLLIKRRFLNA